MKHNNNCNNYNSYPNDMIEINPTNVNDTQDLFTYCWESEESRQAYPNGQYTTPHEHLRIIWIKKELNLGYAIGYKENKVKYYRIGQPLIWQTFKQGFAAQFRHDNT